MKTFLLVFDDGNGVGPNLRSFVDALDDGAEVYAMDGHVWFIKSNLDVSTLTDRFLGLAGSNLFFITETSNSEFSGRMVGPFWDFIKGNALAPAA